MSRLLVLLALIVAIFAIWTIQKSSLAPPGQPPYETGHIQISFDESSIERQAIGSDNWAVTWADDGHQYAPWGDGGGFGGTNSEGRVSLGIARIEGDIDDFRGTNVWGGVNPENQAMFGGKSYGLLSVEGILYMWVSPGSNIESFEESRLYASIDHARTWNRQEWAFTKTDKIISPTFLQFGKDYANARDQFVYVYSPRLMDATELVIQKPGMIDLARVPKATILDRSSYRFFAGLDQHGNPQWSAAMSERLPVFTDPHGTGWSVSVSYNPGLKRYLLITEHSKSMKGNIGIYASPEPWGPWTTVLHTTEPAGLDTTFFWNFSNKWLSEDGKEFVLIFTGVKQNDAWGTIKGVLTAHEQYPD